MLVCFIPDISGRKGVGLKKKVVLLSCAAVLLTAGCSANSIVPSGEIHPKLSAQDPQRSVLATRGERGADPLVDESKALTPEQAERVSAGKKLPKEPNPRLSSKRTVLSYGKGHFGNYFPFKQYASKIGVFSRYQVYPYNVGPNGQQLNLPYGTNTTLYAPNMIGSNRCPIEIIVAYTRNSTDTATTRRLIIRNNAPGGYDQPYLMDTAFENAYVYTDPYNQRRIDVQIVGVPGGVWTAYIFNRTQWAWEPKGFPNGVTGSYQHSGDGWSMWEIIANTGPVGYPVLPVISARDTQVFNYQTNSFEFANSSNSNIDKNYYNHLTNPKGDYWDSPSGSYYNWKVVVN